MGTPLKKIMQRLPRHRRIKVERRAAQLIADEYTLRDLRKAREMTQDQLSEMLSIGQDSVSRLEKRSDLLISTLQGYIKALGGGLKLIAEFPDQPPVELTGFGVTDAMPRKRSSFKRKIKRSNNSDGSRTNA